MVAGHVTDAAAGETLDFDGHAIMLEATEGILAKKLFYRAALLKPRDVFDLVAASTVLPAAAETAVEASASPRRAQPSGSTRLRRRRPINCCGISRRSASLLKWLLR
jgi:hypothetical protein